MARLQIVTLPTLTVGAVSSPEYLIVLDEVDDELSSVFSSALKQNVKEATGARGVIVFQTRVEVVQ
jgi:hypothetical protein